MSIDFYRRLGAAQLALLRFEHLESHVDADLSDLARQARCEGAWLTEGIEGYTEWVDSARAGYSIGWDWVVQPPSGLLALKAHSIRTNIMLTEPDGTDAGRARTEMHLAELLETWPWTETVLHTLKQASPQLQR
jgi:hypothetical protein